MEKAGETLFSDTSRIFIILISPCFLSSPQVIWGWGLFINKLCLLVYFTTPSPKSPTLTPKP